MMVNENRDIILKKIRDDWGSRIDILISRTSQENISLQDIERLRIDVCALLTSIRHWINTRQKSDELEPDYSILMHGFVDTLISFKSTLDFKFNIIQRENGSNIDDHLTKLQGTAYNSETITTSGLLLIVRTLNEFKMMLADGRATSSLSDPIALIEGLIHLFRELIARREDTELFENRRKNIHESPINKEGLTLDITNHLKNISITQLNLLFETLKLKNSPKELSNDYISGVVKALVTAGKITLGHYPAIKAVFKHLGREYRSNPRAAGESYKKGLDEANYHILKNL